MSSSEQKIVVTGVCISTAPTATGQTMTFKKAGKDVLTAGDPEISGRVAIAIKGGTDILAASVGKQYRITIEELDVTAPTVASTTPAAAAVGVSVNAHPVVAFSDDIKAASIVAGTSIGLKKAGVVQACTAALVGDTVTLTPGAPLDAATVYEIFATTAVQDESGNALAVALSRTFTTA